MAVKHVVGMEGSDWDLCLTGNSVAAASGRRTSSQPRGNIASARSQHSLVSIG